MSAKLKRLLRRAVIIAAIVLTLMVGVGMSPASAESVLRVIPDTDLKILDPIWTTAYITRDHAYMVYDTLFALDENFVPPAANGRHLQQVG